MWLQGLFVLDANVLLNLYRYSASTRDELLSVLRKIEDRLWLPYQVGKEYLDRRPSVITNQRAVYESLQNHLDKVLREVEKRANQLHKDTVVEAKSALEQIRESFEQLRTYLEQREAEVPEQSNLPEDDLTWQVIEKIFAGKVGPPYTEDRRTKIFQEGKKRYADRIPPGYMDQEKGGKEQFGDLLLWFQILDKAEETKKPIVFVTDDQKEDWWWRSHDRIIGPRHELMEEMLHRAGVLFYMYQPAPFMTQAKQYLEQDVSDEAINEAQELAPLHEGSDEADVLSTSEEGTTNYLRFGEVSEKMDLGAQKTPSTEEFPRYLAYLAEKDPAELRRILDFSDTSIDEHIKKPQIQTWKEILRLSMKEAEDPRRAETEDRR
jgi:hypothetical protein